MRLLFLTIVVLLLAQGINAQFLCGIFNTCTTTAEEPAVPTASQSVAPSSSIVPPVASPSPSVPATSSVPSVLPSSSAKPTSVAPSPTSQPEVPSPTSASSSPTLSVESTPTNSPTSSPTPTKKTEEKSGSNIGVIIGSVCGFVAIIGAGFAYAFFSKTRKNNRDKRLYSETNDLYSDNNSYQGNQYNTRPSPALAASAVAAADNIHANHQWESQAYNYGNAAPQAPMATVAKQHDPYYSTAPVSQMGYPTNDNYYTSNNQQYYDPSGAAYYDPQQYHYDPNYIDSQKHQQDIYAVSQQQDMYGAPQHQDPYAAPQHVQSPVLQQINAPITTSQATTVYSAPHSYSNEEKQTVNTNNPNSYR